jgi:1-acyl-sn-glycerol-3-phosphate acyltransferase
MNPGKCRAVFLEELPVAGLTLDDVPMLKEKTHQVMSKKLREYGAAWIKKEEKIENVR